MEEPSAAVFSVPELLERIFSYCSLCDVPALRRVCKQWRGIRFTLHALILSEKASTCVSSRAVDCAAKGDLPGLEELITLCGPARTFTRIVANNAMVVACEAGQLRVAQWLADCAPMGEHWRVCILLRVACRRNRILIVEWLLDHFGLKLTPSDADIVTLFYEACRDGNIEVVQCLGARSEGVASEDWPPSYGPLEAACGKGRLDVAQWLIEHFTFEPAEAFFALREACARNQRAAVEWVVAHCPLPPITGNVANELVESVTDPDMEAWVRRYFGLGG